MSEIARGFDALIGAALSRGGQGDTPTTGGIQLFGTIEEDGVRLDGAETALLPWPVVSMVETHVGDRVSLALVGQRPVITGVIGGATDGTVWEVEQGLDNLGDEVEHVTGLQQEHSEHLTELDEKLKDVDGVLGEVTENLKDVGQEASDAKDSAAESAQSAKDSLEQAIQAGKENVREQRQEFSVGTETAPGSTWTTTAPSVSGAQFLWQRTIVIYGDGREVTLPAFRATGLPGTGVSSITPFFCQLPATSAAPSQPSGVADPPEWSLTEPAYVTDTVLYRSDRVLYDDDRVQWTPVTASSAYEGAVQAMHVANLAQAAAEGLLTIGPDAPEHGPGKVWMQTDEDGTLTGLYQSVSGVWAVYTMITGVLIVPGADGTPTVIDQNGMVIGSIAAESITGLEIAAETIQAYHLVLSSIGKEYLDGEAQGTLEDAEKWAALTLLEPGRITITAGGDRTTKMILDAMNLDFVVGGESRAYIDAKRNLMSIGSALIQENLQVGFHMQTALAGTSVTVVRYVG